MDINSYSNQTTYNLSRRYESIKYIVIHYTATTAPARNNCQYFSTGNRGASADYFIDDGGIWRFNPDVRSYYSWAVGDGKGRYGITNSNSVSIEVVNAGGPFSDAEVSYLRDLTLSLMDELGIPSERVVRHYDASRKSCPMYYVDQGAWDGLKAQITSEPKKEEKKETFNMAECIFYFEDAHEGYPAQSRVWWNHETGFKFLGYKTSVGSTNFLKKCGLSVVGTKTSEPYVKEAYILTQPEAKGTYKDLTIYG